MHTFSTVSMLYDHHYQNHLTSFHIVSLRNNSLWYMYLLISTGMHWRYQWFHFQGIKETNGTRPRISSNRIGFCYYIPRNMSKLTYTHMWPKKKKKKKRNKKRNKPVTLHSLFCTRARKVQHANTFTFWLLEFVLALSSLASNQSRLVNCLMGRLHVVGQRRFILYNVCWCVPMNDT